MVLSRVICPSNCALFGVVTKTFASIHTSFHQLSSEKQTLEVWVTGIKHPTQLYDDYFILFFKGLHILGYLYIYMVYREYNCPLKYISLVLIGRYIHPLSLESVRWQSKRDDQRRCGAPFGTAQESFQSRSQQDGGPVG